MPQCHGVKDVQYVVPLLRICTLWPNCRQRMHEFRKDFGTASQGNYSACFGNASWNSKRLRVRFLGHRKSFGASREGVGISAPSLASLVDSRVRFAWAVLAALAVICFRRCRKRQPSFPTPLAKPVVSFGLRNGHACQARTARHLNLHAP